MYILSTFLIGVSAGILFQRAVISAMINKYPNSFEDYKRYWEITKRK